MNRFWGLQDSSISFCEEDYIRSEYIAEYYNTISGLAYSLVGMWYLNTSLSKETCYSLIALGLSTSLFHGTMRYYGQMADEISMLLVSYYLIKEVHRDMPIELLGVILSSYLMAFDMFPIFFLMFMSLQCYLHLLTDEVLKELDGDWKKVWISKLINYKNYSVLIGGVFWGIDIFLCEHVTFKYYHALWHIFTAISLWFGCDILRIYRVEKLLKSE